MSTRWLFVLVVAGGCASYSSRMGGTPLAPGAGEAGLALDVLVVERGRDYMPWPLPEFSFRRGLRPGIDIGGKVHLLGAEYSVRFALLDRARVSLATAAGLALGYEPVTNNSTDLIYARAMPRLIVELKPPSPASRWPTWIASATPSLTFTGPLTMFAGITEASRFIVRPGVAAAARWPLHRGRAFWLEIGAQPAYVIGGSWLRTAFQGGGAVTW